MKVSDEELERLSSKELIAIIRRLEATIDRLEARIEKLEEEARESKRAKAAFSKGTRKPNPKKPGRKKGEGRFTQRPAPTPGPTDQVQEIDVPLSVDQRECPGCEVPLETTNEIATVEDVPPSPIRVIKRFTVEVGRCPVCGLVVRGRHPDLSPHQNGANAHQVGPNIKTQALSLHYYSGLPLCKVPHVIAQSTGIKLTQSGLSQLACTLSDEGGVLHGHYTELKEHVATSAVVNTDDTGWRINATLAFVMGFFTTDTAYYQIRYRHRHQEVLEVLRPGVKRKLGTDRGKSYEAAVFDEQEMQKCLSHLLKNLSDVEKTKSGRAKAFTRRLTELLREGIALWHRYQRGELSLLSYRRAGKKLQESINYHLRDRVLSDRDNQRLLNGIGHQEDRGRVTLFLRHPEIEPTNNRAERGLRAAVIARKVSHCSKNDRGANAYSVMKSVFVTLSLRTKSIGSAFAGLLRGDSFQVACER
jgi:transposase